MNRATQRFVRRRANESCEYCRLPVWAFAPCIPFEIDHIIAKKHGGSSDPSNLAFSCFHCNSFKGPNIAGVDPHSGRTTSLFHPRRQKWSRHFSTLGPVFVGRTAVGRATIAVLEMNDSASIDHRQKMIELDLYTDIFF